MAQAGLHALVGAAVRKIAPQRKWIMLGIILGSLFPDLDNYAVAVATLLKRDTTGLHRTFTHSIFTILAVILVFYIIARVRNQPDWTSLGLGIGLGIGLHILLDLVLWFNGVNLLWPFAGWVNFWATVTPPAWFMKLMDPVEFLMFGLFFFWLRQHAIATCKDTRFLKALRGWTIGMGILLVVFTPLAFLMTKGFLTLYGACYLIAATAAFVIAIRMRAAIEA
jgi:membrane-bound metal-dependent hydrolase YbcI (DUF457 family)